MLKLLNKINRYFNKLYANINGYFWLPCPVCGEYMGGHEWKLGGSIPIKHDKGYYLGDGICDNCERKLNTKEQLFNKNTINFNLK